MSGIGLGLALSSGQLAGQVLRVASMTAPEIAALDRARTVVVLPGGILEAHGPYLPSFSDGILNERLADSLAQAIAARPGWRALLFPMMPLGNSAANDIAGRYTFPGSYTVRFETLRAVYMDLADALGEQGFRQIFVVQLHGAPNHSRALDDAGDYFHDTYRGYMVHLAGLLPVFGALEGPKSASERAADGLPIHAGMDETSLLAFLAPSLVRSDARNAPDYANGTMEGLVRLSQRAGWPGYFGAPRLASVAHGQHVWRALADSTIGVALRIVDGLSPRSLPRFADELAKSPVDVRLDAASRRAERRQAVRQAAWLRLHGHP
ncbi:MAG: creatininase family protein [Gemmatimonadaceae bacterium]